MKDKEIHIRVTNEEKELFKKLAKENNMSISDLCISSVMNKNTYIAPIRKYIEKEDAYDRKLENNINQIAKIVNAQKFADTTELRKFNLSINEIIILRQKKIDIFKKLYKILKR